MRIRSLNMLAAALALGLLAGCATPCGAPGRLCAPVETNTSALPATEPALPPPAVQTAPVASPQPRSGPVRIALLVPLNSDTLGAPAQALRDGFLAGWERDREGFAVEVMATGNDDRGTLAAYRQAAARSDVVVGPLSRSAVQAVAASGDLPTPTVALNHLRGAPPRNMLAIGLSIEDEARQLADWAHSEQPTGAALLVAGPVPWQRRMAQAFEARWSELGRTLHTAELPVANGYVDANAIFALRNRAEGEAPAFLLAALDAEELRQVRSGLGTTLPCYAASPANPGRAPGIQVAELEGVRLLDLPWQVQPDHPAVMLYPRLLADGNTLEMDRLYALGIDAFRVARQLALQPGVPFELDGVTGNLSATPGAQPSFKRTVVPAVYRDGTFQTVATGQ